MKKIVINGTVLYYSVWLDHHDSFPYTEFYLLNGKKPEKKWSWRKFRFLETGNMIDNFDDAFSLNFDIESPDYTKSEVRSMIERKVKLLYRAEEIKKGEII